MKLTHALLLAAGLLTVLFVFGTGDGGDRGPGPDDAPDELPGATDGGVLRSGGDREPERTAPHSRSDVPAGDRPENGNDVESTTPGQTTDVPLSAVEAERDAILEKLRDPFTPASEQSELWRRIGELGVADDVIAALRAELEKAPLDDELHTMLGNAHVTKMRSENLGPAERRAASRSAMASFDKALEIDSRNWTARFSRAMSNSSAPAFLGLQKSAIQDFETLLTQQKESPFSEDHAHTYFFLGNLHDGAGNSERAAEVRAEARTRFPTDPRFQKK